VTTLDGQVLSYNRPQPTHGVLVAAGRERHAALIELMRAHSNQPA
jgi:myo-inositol-1(or 4)-monophosphatase